MIKNIIAFVTLIVLFNGCTKDDICSENINSTPLLIVRFYDNVINDQLKAVTDLVVLTEQDSLIEVISRTPTDSIAIPLSTTSDTTRYIFKKLTINVNDTLINNEDKITFIYNRSQDYVNRACGYRISYTNLKETLVNDGQNWILRRQIIRDTVKDEKSAHINIFH